MPSSEPVLQATGLERRFGPLRVLRGLDLAVPAGALQLVAGANGAGKSTLLRLLAGLMRPTRGAVDLHGRPVREAIRREAIGILSHQSLLYDDLTARENLTFAARLYGLPDPIGVASTWLDRMGVAARGDTAVMRLSRGTVQRVAIARALLHDPRVLLLDEPFTGLDGAAVDLVRDVLADRLRGGVAVVLVTHGLGEAWDLASRVSVLARGAWAIDEPVTGPVDPFLPRYREAIRG